MMKGNTKQLSKKIISISLISYLLLILFLSVTLYLSSIKQSRKLVLDKLNGIAMTACSQLDAKAVEHLSKSYLTKDAITANDQDSLYLKLHQQLAEIHKKNQLKTPIYVMQWVEKKGHFEFLCTSNPTPYFRHTFLEFPKEIELNYEVGGKVGPYESENGTWLSAFTPIFNSNNKVIGLLQVDQDFRAFRKQALIDFFSFLGSSFFVALIFFGFIFYFLKNITKQAEKNEEQLQDSYALLNKQKEKLEEAQTEIKSYNKRLEIEVKERTKSLSKTNSELDQFVYRASHNLRAPLTSIKELIMITREEKLTEEAIEYLNFMDETTDKLDQVIRDIIDYSKNNRIEIQRSPINVRGLLEKTVKANLHQLKKFKPEIDLNFNLKNKGTIFISDKERVQIVLNNLISNAIHHSKPESDHPKININVTQEKSALIFEISDDGVGIDAEIQDKIFNLFFVGNPYSQGSGIGLYVVREVLQKLNGSIEFSSNDIKGTTFKVYLPSMKI